MDDSEVGEIWKHNQVYGGLSPAITRLILKLIEERAIWHNEGKKSGRERYIEFACRDFGIPYDEYLKAKEQSRERGAETRGDDGR